MSALLKIERIYKALRLFADLQGPIRYNLLKFAYHFHINYALNLETAEFLALGLCDSGETLFNASH